MSSLIYHWWCSPDIPINIPIIEPIKHSHYVYVYIYEIDDYIYISNISHQCSIDILMLRGRSPQKPMGDPLIPWFDRSFPGLSSVKATDRRSEPDLWGREIPQQNTAENMGNLWLVGTSNLVGSLEHGTGWWFGTWLDYFSIYWEYLGISSSQLTTVIFFRRVGIPPASNFLLFCWCRNPIFAIVLICFSDH